MESNEKTAGSNLTPIAEYSETAAALGELRQRHQGVVFDVTKPKEMKAAKEARAELRTLRTGLEKKRVEIKAPALERCRLIDAEAKRITAELVALEDPIDVQIKAEEARAESERLAKLEAERLRVEAIQQKIQAIRDVPAGLVGKPSVVIAGQLANLQKTTLDEAELGVDFVPATDALTAAIARVEQLLAAQKDAEAEQARIKAEREELERIRAENERLQREADERAAADRAEADRKAQAERDRIAAEERARREAEAERVQRIRDRISEVSFVAPIANRSPAQIDEYIAERKKLDPRDTDDNFDYGDWRGEACEAFDRALEQYHEMRRKAVQREREEYEAAERRAEEQRQLQAERERQAAEQRKLDEQAAQLKREREAAAAKAEADRLANLGLREAAQAVVAAWDDGETLEQSVSDLRAALANDENRTAEAVTVNRANRAARA